MELVSTEEKSNGSHSYTFRRSANLPATHPARTPANLMQMSFYVGDQVMLSTDDGVIGLASGTITSLQSDRVVVDCFVPYKVFGETLRDKRFYRLTLTIIVSLLNRIFFFFEQKPPTLTTRTDSNGLTHKTFKGMMEIEDAPQFIVQQSQSYRKEDDTFLWRIDRDSLPAGFNIARSNLVCETLAKSTSAYSTHTRLFFLRFV
jgi:hypothetical protein